MILSYIFLRFCTFVKIRLHQNENGMLHADDMMHTYDMHPETIAELDQKVHSA